MSLKVIAEQTLARLRSGDVGRETTNETQLKQVKQERDSCFTDGSLCFMPMKQGLQGKSAEYEPCFTVSFPRVETNETRLPQHVSAGLQRLRSMPVPRGIAAPTWAEVVVDAVALGATGWAAEAMALGWSDLDLFGAVTDPRGDPAADGLAVKLCGRRLAALSESFATIAGADGGRAWHYRRDTAGAVLLWDISNRKDVR
jgi:hypothetical protein